MMILLMMMMMNGGTPLKQHFHLMRGTFQPCFKFYLNALSSATSCNSVTHIFFSLHLLCSALMSEQRPLSAGSLYYAQQKKEMFAMAVQN